MREIASSFKQQSKEITIYNCALDGTDIQVKAPDDKYQLRYYLNPKNNYSINPQAICDTQNRFLYAYLGKEHEQEYSDIPKNVSLN